MIDPFIWQAVNSGVGLVVLGIVLRLTWHYSQTTLMVRTLWEKDLELGRRELRGRGYNPHPPSPVEKVCEVLAWKAKLRKRDSDAMVATKVVRALEPELLAYLAEDLGLSPAAVMAAIVMQLRATALA